MASTTPANSITIQGDISLIAAPPGYLRVNNKGPEENYLDIPTGGITLRKHYIPPPPGSPVEYVVDVIAQLRFSDYPQPITTTAPVIPVHRGGGLPQGLYGIDGTPLKANNNNPGQLTSLTGTSKDGVMYSLALSTSPTASPREKSSWAEVWITLSKGASKNSPAPPPLTFSITYNPLLSLLGVGVLCNNVTLAVRAQSQLIYDPRTQKVSDEVASLERILTYNNDFFSRQTVSMDGASTDPGIYLPIAGVYWPYTDIIGYFAPALAYLAAQTADTLPPAQPTPLYVLAQLQYGNNPGLKYPPSENLDQFINNSISQIGPALGPFAAEFLPPDDSGIQPWIDAASWMGWVLAKGVGVVSLKGALTEQYNYWKNFVPSVGKTGETGNPPPNKDLPVGPAPGQYIWNDYIEIFRNPDVTIKFPI